jgi:hypothetical protein
VWFAKKEISFGMYQYNKKIKGLNEFRKVQHTPFCTAGI